MTDVTTTPDATPEVPATPAPEAPPPADVAPVEATTTPGLAGATGPTQADPPSPPPVDGPADPRTVETPAPEIPVADGPTPVVPTDPAHLEALVQRLLGGEIAHDLSRFGQVACRVIRDVVPGSVLGDILTFAEEEAPQAARMILLGVVERVVPG